MAKAFFVDLTRCTGCRGCQIACKQWKNLPAEETTNRGGHTNPPDLSSVTYKTVHMIGLPWHFGWLVPKRGGDSANLLTAAVGDPNSAIPESKAFMVNIEKMPDQDLPE